MEQWSENLNKRGVVSEDRISELPEALLIQILSSLPTKLVISTSVLSKRWRSVWEMMPNLEFESYGNINEFAENVSKSLMLHKAPILESLHLKTRDRCEDVYVGIWAGIAFNRHVRDFVLDLNFHIGNPVRFPCSLFCFNQLETLKLKNQVLLDVPSLVPMKSLRTLHLHFVAYKDDDSFRNLLSSCPNVEHLVVRRHFHFNDVASFVIVAPYLKTLSLYDTTAEVGISTFVINAPSLEFLNIEMLQGYRHFQIENSFGLLVEANIRNVSSVADEMVMGILNSAKRLSLDLSPLQIKFPTGVIFYQLVCLEMYTNKNEWWNLLTLMLDSSPKLQVLKLIDDSSRKEHMDFDAGKWNQPKHVPECLLSHLETLVWTRYDWTREEEKEVATYILRNARRLKKATFTTYAIEAKRLYKLARRREKLSELDSVVRASSSCELVFQDE